MTGISLSVCGSSIQNVMISSGEKAEHNMFEVHYIEDVTQFWTDIYGEDRKAKTCELHATMDSIVLQAAGEKGDLNLYTGEAMSA